MHHSRSWHRWRVRSRARLVARYIGKYIPATDVTVQNCRAGSVTAANYVWGVAKPETTPCPHNNLFEPAVGQKRYSLILSPLISSLENDILMFARADALQVHV
jgi:hypothetical protein